MGRVVCDGCDVDPIATTRFVCTTCLGDSADPEIDLCWGCFTDNKSVNRGAIAHTPDHSVIQLRAVGLRVYMHPTFSAAKSALSRVKKGIAARKMRCFGCDRLIVERPYWCCVTCRGALSVRIVLLLTCRCLCDVG